MNKTILLIPHFNNFDGLIKTISNVESTENLDIIVVDDGSEISKIDEEILNNYIKFNGKILYLFLSENSGIEIALNTGLSFINDLNKYKYIARIDCGDISINNRFKIQEEFLELNPNIHLIGSFAQATDVNGNDLYVTTFPESHEELTKYMYINSMFLHPCVMFRSSIIQEIGLYPVNYKAAEDYAYFFNILKKYQTYNIQSILTKYEINTTGISASKRKLQVKNRIKIIIKHFYFGFWPIYGLLRNIILYFLPQSIILKLKKSLNGKS